MFDDPDYEFPLETIKKICLALLTLIIPLVAIMVFFSPFTEKTQEKSFTEKYYVPLNFTRQDLSIVVENMKLDKEFQGYFQWLSKIERDVLTEEVYMMLEQNRDKEVLLGLIKSLQEKINSIAFGFNMIEVDEEFYEHPGKYPEVTKTIGLFIGAEFKATLLGICYKSLYDPEFQFNWSPTTRQAAYSWLGIAQLLYEKYETNLSDILTRE